jgi:hypothetical protein
VINIFAQTMESITLLTGAEPPPGGAGRPTPGRPAPGAGFVEELRCAAARRELRVAQANLGTLRAEKRDLVRLAESLYAGVRDALGTSEIEAIVAAAQSALENLKRKSAEPRDLRASEAVVEQMYSGLGLVYAKFMEDKKYLGLLLEQATGGACAPAKLESLYAWCQNWAAANGGPEGAGAAETTGGRVQALLGAMLEQVEEAHGAWLVRARALLLEQRVLVHERARAACAKNWHEYQRHARALGYLRSVHAEKGLARLPPPARPPPPAQGGARPGQAFWAELIASAATPESEGWYALQLERLCQEEAAPGGTTARKLNNCEAAMARLSKDRLVCQHRRAAEIRLRSINDMMAGRFGRDSAAERHRLRLRMYEHELELLRQTEWAQAKVWAEEHLRELQCSELLTGSLHAAERRLSAARDEKECKPPFSGVAHLAAWPI